MSFSVGSCQWPGVVGCHNGPLLWSCGDTMFYVVAAAGVSLLRRVPYLISCWCVRWASDFSSIIWVVLIRESMARGVMFLLNIKIFYVNICTKNVRKVKNVLPYKDIY